jgi:hypothetical protein
VSGYLDIPIGRLWRLIVTKTDIQTEYLVPEAWLGDLVESVTAEPDIRNVKCLPYHAAADQGPWARKAWMSSSPWTELHRAA